MYPMNTRIKHYDKASYEVVTQRDDNGDLLLPLPPELLDRLGWVAGTEIDVEVDADGRLIVRRAP